MCIEVLDLDRRDAGLPQCDLHRTSGAIAILGALQMWLVARNREAMLLGQERATAS